MRLGNNDFEFIYNAHVYDEDIMLDKPPYDLECGGKNVRVVNEYGSVIAWLESCDLNGCEVSDKDNVTLSGRVLYALLQKGLVVGQVSQAYHKDECTWAVSLDLDSTLNAAFKPLLRDILRYGTMANESIMIAAVYKLDEMLRSPKPTSKEDRDKLISAISRTITTEYLQRCLVPPRIASTDSYAVGIRPTTTTNSKNTDNRKENEKMTNLANKFNLRMGKVNGTDFSISFDGNIAYRNKYYSDGALHDCLGLSIEANGMLYIIPQNEIKAGDIVVSENGKPSYYDGSKFIDLETGEKSEYVPTKVFNMTFYSVVKNLMAGAFANVGKDNPMGNMLPFLLMKDGGDNDNLLLAMMLSGGNLFGAANKTESK